MTTITGKDYTITCDCGLEQYEQSKRQSFAEAKKHKRQCRLDSPKVIVDESEDGELNDKWWTF